MAHRERRRLRRSHLSPSRPILVRVERLSRGSNLLREGYVFLWGRHRERDCDYVPGGGAQTIRPHRRANGRSFPARPVLDVVGSPLLRAISLRWIAAVRSMITPSTPCPTPSVASMKFVIDPEVFVPNQ